MGFYDNYNLEGTELLHMIKIRPQDCLSEPCREFQSAVKELKLFPPLPEHISVAEIGIGYGATSLAILQMLDAGDTYYGFDFEDRLQKFRDDLHILQERNFNIKCQVVMKGNSRSPDDSYNWNLSNMIFEMRERREAGLFDAVYLDAAHTFLYTGLGICLLKELIKDNGFLILDDVYWKLSTNELFKNKAIKEGVPQEQIEDAQILRAEKIFLNNDPNFEKTSKQGAWRSVFRKHSRS